MSKSREHESYKDRIQELEFEKKELEKVIKAYEALDNLSQKELNETHNLVEAYKKVHELSKKEILGLKKEIYDAEKIHNHLEKEIIKILDEDIGNEEYIINQFNLLHKKSGDDFFVDLFKVLINIEFPPDEAGEYWKKIMYHKKFLSNRIGKEMNFRVAMLDYFINVNKKIKNPKIIEIKLFEKTIKFALVDELTGLYNRKYYDDIIEKELNRAKRHKRILSLCVIDIDDFKHYNDEFGHIEGDKVLETFGIVIQQCLRKEDVICRYGGEEFVAIMPEVDNADALKSIERLRRELYKYKFKDGHPITFSAGVAVFPIDADNKSELFIKADKAMYTAKSNGKDQTCIYGHERRGKKRIPVDWQVTYSILKYHNGKYIQKDFSEGQAKDISLEGICFETDKRLNNGDILKVVFNNETGDTEIDRNAEVVWVTNKESHDGNYKIGLKFVEVD